VGISGARIPSPYIRFWPRSDERPAKKTIFPSQWLLTYNEPSGWQFLARGVNFCNQKRVMNVSRDMEAVLPASEVLVGVPSAAEADWETALIESCQSGDPEAFRLLMQRYQRKVFSIAYALVRRRADVEDIAQQVFTKVYFGLRQFDFRCALLTWIYRITVNECYDYLRKQRAAKMQCLSEMTEEDARQAANTASSRVSPERQVEMAQTVSLLLGKLTADERLLLVLKEVEGYSIQELARMFAWNENTVKVKLFRARQRLVRAARKTPSRKG